MTHVREEPVVMGWRQQNSDQSGRLAHTGGHQRAMSPLFESGITPAGPLGAADAPLATDNDKPAAPKIGKALIRRLRLEYWPVSDMGSSHDIAPVCF